MASTNLIQVRSETQTLDKAKLVDIKIDDGGVIKSVDNYNGIYNVSKGEFCCVVSKNYKLIQHEDFFNTFVGALDRLNISYSIDFKSTNNTAIADITFVGRNIKYDKLDEEFTTGIRLANSFDRRTGVTIAPRLTRLACSNGMILSRFEKKLSIRHTSEDINKIDAVIEKKIASIINNDIDLQSYISDGLKDSVEWLTACKIVAKLFTTYKHRKGILEKLNINVTKEKGKVSYNRKNNNITSFNRWQLYNAVTSYVTHGEHITPLIEGMLQQQSQKLLFEKLETIKI